MALHSKVPGGPLAEKWDRHRFESKLVNPANRRKYTVIIVGTGLAGASAASSLGELGYNVLSFCIQDSPRRAHSIAAQGGINAAKNYQNDGDSIHRLFYDTVKGGDYRSREANAYRLAAAQREHHRSGGRRQARRIRQARHHRPALTDGHRAQSNRHLLLHLPRDARGRTSRAVVARAFLRSC